MMGYHLVQEQRHLAVVLIRRHAIEHVAIDSIDTRREDGLFFLTDECMWAFRVGRPIIT